MTIAMNERSRKILEAIVEDYIASAEPVGSKSVSCRHQMGLSPATVRNVMADLEAMGYLASPHASAGRIPTDKGYRFYVDTLLQLRPLKAEERERIERQYASSDRRIDEVLREAVKSLSRLSRYAGIVMAPRVEATVFRHIDFVPLAPGRVLVIFVSRSGEVQNKIIETGINLPAATLEQMTNYLNRVMNGLPLDAVREKIAAEMAQAKIEHDDLQQRVLALSGQALAGEDENARVYIEGTSNILDQPEFADVERMRQLYRVFEQKSQLVDLLDRSRRAHGIQIFIGNETSHSAIAGCSLVTATYETREGTIGSLGVIGPSRMPYGQVIPIVDYTARIVSQLLEEEYQ